MMSLHPSPFRTLLLAAALGFAGVIVTVPTTPAEAQRMSRGGGGGFRGGWGFRPAPSFGWRGVAPGGFYRPGFTGGWGYRPGWVGRPFYAGGFRPGGWWGAYRPWGWGGWYRPWGWWGYGIVPSVSIGIGLGAYYGGYYGGYYPPYYPSYYPPYYSPYYAPPYPPGASYPYPAASGATCVAGAVMCPLQMPAAPGDACNCPTPNGAAWGRVGG